MSVIITPSEQLEFHRPFTRISKESLIVKNPGTEPIVFKVKTTAPKQYCVRPNAGRIEANSDIEVQIILQPFKEELPEDFKCKDKFLVQTAPIKPALESLDISSMWSQIETTDKSSMHQHKIKCVFLPPSKEEQQQQVEENKVASIPETAATAEPIASSSSKEEEEQVVPPPAIVADNTITSPPPPITTTALPVVPSPSIIEEEKPVATTTDTTTTTTPPPVITSPPPITTTTPATTTTTTTTTPVKPVTKPAAQPPVVSSREIKKDDSNKDTELKAALEKIALLEKQLSDIRKEEGLRARNQTGTSNRKLASTVQPLDAVHQHLAALEKPRPTEGYPPQVVFGVAFLVFIITYLFF